MNILHIDEQRGWRGGEQQVSYLIQGLVAQGHRCYIAARPDTLIVERMSAIQGLQIVPLPLRGEFDLRSARKLAKLIRDEDIDIVHGHTGHAHSIACLARSLAGTGKVVASRRVDFIPKNHFFNRLKYAMPDHYITVSHAIKTILLQFGIPEEKVTAVHSCIDPKRFQVPPVSREDLGVPKDALLIGNVAALVGHKDHQTLLDAMPEVLREIPNAYLAIAGEGDLRPDIEMQIERLNLSKHVSLLGYRNDIPGLLASLDLFVLSSKEEGLGTSVLDAMISRVPVVATCAGGIPEMVSHEDTGLLSPVQDPHRLAQALIRLSKDTKLAKELAENAHALVTTNFVVDQMVAGTLRVYQSLLQ